MSACSATIIASLAAPAISRCGGKLGRRATVALRKQHAAARGSGVVVNVVAPSMHGVSNREPSEEVIALVTASTGVAFDVDSTVCTDEGIDELAAFLGKGEEVAAMTAKAMGGGINFRDALEMRLQAMQPTRQSVEKYLSTHTPAISPGVRELFTALRASGKTVYLVSGGFRQMIAPVAAALGVPNENIFANKILFNEDGSYAGFDPTEFTSKAGGKAEAVKHIKQSSGHAVMVMVGDGATDLEAKAPGGADVFIGYGGVQNRKAVADGADWFVMDFDGFVGVVKGGGK
mmetsp:Transcript_6028/g.15368  ORF Transcript_6028/g.15368 Transcript_6028/m.15368 type:complete len:289 (-) Transcript_6028:160-1026(-)